MTKAGAVSVPGKEGVWYASGDLKDSDGSAITPRTGCGIMVVRVVIKSYVRDAGKFTLGQLRLICMPKDLTLTPGALTGKGVNAYSIGYFSGKDEITTKGLSELITVHKDAFPAGKQQRNIDFAFNVPNEYTPVALQFKQNVISKVPRAVSSDQAPPVTPFVEKTKTEPEESTPSNTDIYGSPQQPPQNQDSSGNTERRPMTPVQRVLTGGVTEEDLNQ